jgi:hypothetical protein
MADSFDILRPGRWFGPRSGTADAPESGSSSDRVKLHQLCNELKNGHFEARAALETFILECADYQVRRQAIRLYCFAARHADIAFIGRLAERLEHDEVETIAVTAPDTLSPEIIPYLLALLEPYEGTAIEKSILSSIDMLFPFGYDDGQVNLPRLRDHFAGLAHKLEAGRYYFKGVPAFPGTWTKELIEVAALARHKKTRFPLVHVPTLLSVFSGEWCPVFYGDVVDDGTFQKVLDYAKVLAGMTWDPGMKYFYHHPVL